MKVTENALLCKIMSRVVLDLQLKVQYSRFGELKSHLLKTLMATLNADDQQGR